MKNNLALTSLAFALLSASLFSGDSHAANTDNKLQLLSEIQQRDYRGNDDLLSAGLGENGLRSPIAPALSNAEKPSAEEVRRRAIWTNWRGIADLSTGGGFGEFYGSFEPVPGREY
ncbi:MAG: 3-hydroxybutyrate oligomer hydrolase family protein, partial [Arenimonas sp.]